MYFVVVVAAVCCVTWFVWWRRNLSLPPGPIGLPIIGYLHKLGGKSLHFIMHDLSKKYGDVFCLKLGSRLTIILSSHEAIYEAYVKKAKLFAGRPDFASFIKTNHDAIGLSLCTFSQVYENNRKGTMRAIHRLHSSTASYNELLQKEAKKMLELFDNSINSHNAVDPLKAFKRIVPSAFLAMMFGRDFDYHNEEFLDIVEWFNNWFENAEADNPPDFFPILQNMPNKRLKIISDCGLAFEKFALKKLKEFENENGDTGLVYSFYNYFGKPSELGRQEKLNLARVVADLCGGGFDTVASTLAWAPLYLLNRPEVLRKCRQEILSICKDGDVSVDKKDDLPYFSATLYDIIRHSSVGPLGLPRVTMDDLTFRSYKIPKNTMVFVNLWACNHDPSVWKEIDFVHPENFLTNDGALDNTAVKKLSTFSSGVRRCPGEKLAFTKMFVLLGTLIQRYGFIMDKAPEDLLPMRGVTLKPKPYTISMKRLHLKDILSKKDF
ncbi:cytochrome P450 1A2-like [Hydractinia symbiolongicarpus]|uniref:cytochrome P450 1A2-like n=1 Tax=Hydractinia symbiolongicarpus TaxID=13093 RepID=UPI00254DDBD1|nr:cytochrome P450 1A2-like [Hydractinia symbiolongicarpus]